MNKAKKIKTENSRSKALSPATNATQIRAIATFFKELRELNGMSLEDLASAMGGREVETLATYERGEIAIPLEDIFAMTNILNVSPEAVIEMIAGIYKDTSSL